MVQGMFLKNVNAACHQGLGQLCALSSIETGPNHYTSDIYIRGQLVWMAK
jgi:hypothetical protein